MKNVVFPSEDLKYFGIDLNELDTVIKEQLATGKVTDVITMKVPYSFEMETYLNKKEVPFRLQNNEIQFEGRIQLKPEVKIENSPENIELLKINNINDFKIEDDKISFQIADIQHISTLLLTTLNPLVTLALFLIFKQLRPKLEDKNLTEEEITKLEKGELIKHNFGNGEALLQVDKATNSLVSVPMNAMIVPQKVLNVDLSPMQKEKLRNAEMIKIGDISLRLDLTKPNGLQAIDEQGKEVEIKSEMNSEMREKFLYDLYDDSVMDTISTDENKNKYLAYIREHIETVKSSGYDAIERIHPNEPLKQLSLIRFLGIETEFQQYKNLASELEKTENVSQKTNIKFEMNRLNDAIKSKAGEKLHTREENMKQETKIKR